MCTFYVIAIRLANEKSSDKEDHLQAEQNIKPVKF